MFKVYSRSVWDVFRVAQNLFQASERSILSLVQVEKQKCKKIIKTQKQRNEKKKTETTLTKEQRGKEAQKKVYKEEKMNKEANNKKQRNQKIKI